MTRLRLSEHFIVEEFDCHDGTRVPPSALASLAALCKSQLEPLRAEFGAVKVHSGYRHSKYNQSIHGARSSFHIYELRTPRQVAADVECARGRVKDWHRFIDHLQRALRTPSGGLGFYPQGGFIHVDNRLYLSRWNGS